MKAHRLALFVLAVAALCTAVQAQKSDFRRMPGYVDLEMIEIPAEAEEVTDIDLGPELLRFASLDDSDDDDLSRVLLGRP